MQIFIYDYRRNANIHIRLTEKCKYSYVIIVENENIHKRILCRNANIHVWYIMIGENANIHTR